MRIIISITIALSPFAAISADYTRIPLTIGANGAISCPGRADAAFETNRFYSATYIKSKATEKEAQKQQTDLAKYGCIFLAANSAWLPATEYALRGFEWKTYRPLIVNGQIGVVYGEDIAPDSLDAYDAAVRKHVSGDD